MTWWTGFCGKWTRKIQISSPTSFTIGLFFNYFLIVLNQEINFLLASKDKGLRMPADIKALTEGWLELESDPGKIFPFKL